MDITMPGRTGLDALKDIKAVRPGLPVLVLSIHPEDQYALRALKAGAAGYMTKESAPEELVKAVLEVVAGRCYVSAAIAARLAGGSRRKGGTAPPRDAERPRIPGASHDRPGPDGQPGGRRNGTQREDGEHIPRPEFWKNSGWMERPTLIRYALENNLAD